MNGGGDGAVEDTRFLNIHVWNVLTVMRRWPHMRSVVEYGFLAFAVAMLMLVIVLHTRFVGRPASCLAHLTNDSALRDVHILCVQVEGPWTSLNSWEESRWVASEESTPDVSGAATTPLWGALSTRISTWFSAQQHDPDRVSPRPEDPINQMPGEDLHIFRRQSKPVLSYTYSIPLFEDPQFFYAREKGFLMLPFQERQHHHVNTVNVTVSSSHTCFGGWFIRGLLDWFIGYDTVIQNELAALSGNHGSIRPKGYVYSTADGELYNLNTAAELEEMHMFLEDHVIARFDLLISIVAQFIIIRSLVSLQVRVTHTILFETIRSIRRTRGSSIFRNLLQLFKILPLFFCVIEFVIHVYDDEILGIGCMAMAWFSEMFLAISGRTEMTARFFNPFLLIYFTLLNLYVYSYPNGFTHSVLLTALLFLVHLICFFWNHFEVQAVMAGTVTRATPRMAPLTPRHPPPPPRHQPPPSPHPIRFVRTGNATYRMVPVEAATDTATIRQRGLHTHQSDMEHPRHNTDFETTM